MRSIARTALRPSSNELQKCLRRDGQTGVGSQERLQHFKFVVSHEFDTVVNLGKGAKDVYETFSRNDGLVVVVYFRFGVVVEDGVQLFLDICQGLSVSAIGGLILC
jgi:hypothetical protein